MRPGGGKQKGSQFERDICRSLSDWLVGHGGETIFWRSSLSGGRATISFRKNQEEGAQAGDVSAISDVGFRFSKHFYIECKRYRHLGVGNLIYGKKCQLFEFWEDTVKESLKYGKQPLLIAKEDRCPIIVCSHKFINSPTKTKLLEAPVYLEKYTMGVWLLEEFTNLPVDDFV